MKRIWLWILAFLRLDPSAVCEMSKGRGLVDFHDFPDSIEGYPWHFCELTCARCGKRFTI